MALADVVFTTSVGFHIFNYKVCRVFLFFFLPRVRILQRGHDHANLHVPVKGYGVRSTSCLNNNARLQYFIIKGKLSVTAEFVVLLRDYAFSNNSVKMIVPMPDVVI